MPCRVGITTNYNERKAQWESQVVGFRNWRILKRFKSREKAQEYETWYAKRYGCHASGGGRDDSGMWYVYRFEYTRIRN